VTSDEQRFVPVPAPPHIPADGNHNSRGRVTVVTFPEHRAVVTCLYRNDADYQDHLKEKAHAASR
jgi:hypothetical protein